MNKDTYTAQRTTWARPNDRQIEAFFRDADNIYQGMRVSSIIYAIGPFDSEVDWDRGHWVYEWNRRSFRIRVTTQSAYITCVELLGVSSDREHCEELWHLPKETAVNVSDG